MHIVFFAPFISGHLIKTGDPEMKLQWSKVYKVNHEKGIFKIYISSPKKDFYQGSILHSLWTVAAKEVKDLEFEAFTSDSEEKVYEACVNEIEKKIPGKFTVALKEYKKY
jgi:hypothetical protein